MVQMPDTWWFGFMILGAIALGGFAAGWLMAGG